MNIVKNVFYFDKDKLKKKVPENNLLGIRGKQAIDLAALELPILPGLIIDSEAAPRLDEADDILKSLSVLFKNYAEQSGKVFDNPDNPMLLKIVISSNLAIARYPALHNFGLADNTFEGFSGFVGKDFACHEILFMMNGVLQIMERIAELEENKKRAEKFRELIDELDGVLGKELKADEYSVYIDQIRKELPPELFSNASEQMETVLRMISRLIRLEDAENTGVAIMVQPMVYGNYGKDSCSGYFATRNTITGDAKIEGEFFQNRFNESESAGTDIEKIEQKYYKKFDQIARILESESRDIRKIGFTIENGRMWLINQNPVASKSTRALLKLLMDLRSKKVIDDKELINSVKPGELNELLHPVIDRSSVKGVKVVKGGISGAPGAAQGRVFFSTDSLLEEYKDARMNDRDDRLILCLTSSFAEDVKAIEVANGVLSSEGGYSAHASVVARQYGKVSLVNPDLKITQKKAEIGGNVIKEGDYITLNVPDFSEPEMFFGKTKLIKPDPSENGLLEFSVIVKQCIKGFEIRANCDKAADAELALKFGADGIGLCRTEHMFFNEDRINVFREMIFAEDEEQRKKILTELKKMQKKDFSEIFRVMDGKEVTIRLLDAPLHEFLPHNPQEQNAFLEYIKKARGTDLGLKKLNYLTESLKEFNPMLGHRGCRIAVSYPEIYQMQVEAIFEAAYELTAEKIKVRPEIMIPLIMNSAELKMIAYGKKIEGYHYKGLSDIETEVRARMKAKPLHYKIGTMIELPAAALSAGEIARYAQFFSFGTNDLTQTTLGLSRDDFTSFMPDYTLYDLLDGNPFRTLEPPVKELVATAVRRGTTTRPDLVKGLCGEHGAAPENIEFCMENGLDYVSCSTYSVPIAALAAAQVLLKR